jgi:hypothetical protein
MAATMMAVQNISLAAVSLGLGTHIKTGAIMQDPAARARSVCRRVRESSRCSTSASRRLSRREERKSASSLTKWLP